MITQTELLLARDTLLERTVSFFAGQPDVTGIFLAAPCQRGALMRTQISTFGSLRRLKVSADS
jgi:hypothetical protein